MAQYTLLEQSTSDIFGPKALPSFSGSATSFSSSLYFLYAFLFSFIVVVAFYRYSVAGILRMQASQKGVTDSNEIIKRTTLGLLGVFSLFLILTTVNKDLLSGNVGLEELKTEPLPNVAPAVAVVPTSVPRAPSTAADTGDAGLDAIRNDPVVRQTLLSAGISINKRVCVTPVQTSCTTVGSLPQETINMLLQLRTTCPGIMTITGGTEAGHSSHGPGKYPVDLSIGDTRFENCVRGFTKSARVPTRRDGSPLCYTGRVYENFGYVFCDEQYSDRHFHVYK